MAGKRRRTSQAYTGRYTDEEYRKWRMAVLRRDKKTCRLCGVTRKKFNVHHIQRWADAPELRLDVNNGITLCIACHKQVTGNEVHYASLFIEKVHNPTIEKDDVEILKEIMRKLNGKS